MSSSNITFRHMNEYDLSAVLDIIEAHDDDDAQAAELSFTRFGVGGHYVMIKDDTLIGISGAREIDNSDQGFQLSWTYVDKAHCNKGYGRQLLNHVMVELATYNARKVFV